MAPHPHGVLDGFTIVPNFIARNPEVSALEKTIYLILATYTDRFGFCHPSLQTIARNAGCSVNTALKGIRLLEKKGYLTRRKRFKEGGRERTSNEYQLRLHDTRPEDMPNTSVGKDVDKGVDNSSEVLQNLNDPTSKSERPYFTGCSTVLQQLNSNKTQLTRPNELYTPAPEETPPSTVDNFEEEFNKFWEEYPRKEKREAALKEFKKALAAGASAEQLIQAARAYSIDPALPTDRKYIAMPHNWLKAKRWTDELVKTRKERRGITIVPEFDTWPAEKKRRYAYEWWKAYDETNDENKARKIAAQKVK